jgi:hypothetical protein
VISTPRSKKTKFFELCSDPETYSYHFCDIHHSVACDGFVLRDNKGNATTVEAFKKLYGDDSGWTREYECKFTGDLDALVQWAQLLTARDPDLTVRILRVESDAGWSDDFFGLVRQLPAGRLELGWDVARHKHYSPLWCNLARRDGKKDLAALVLMHNTRFETQRHIIFRAMDSRAGNVGCGDATGLGEDSNETLEAKYPDRWQGVKFTSATKSEIGSSLRTAYGDGLQRIPDFTTRTETKFIATDIYSVQCQPTGDAADKRLLLSETENELEENSHCDIAYANGLALRAAGLVGGRRGAGRGTRRHKPSGW